MKVWAGLQEIKGAVQYETAKNIYISYTAVYNGQTYGYINVFDKRRGDLIFKATRRRQRTQDELKDFAERYEKKPVIKR